MSSELFQSLWRALGASFRLPYLCAHVGAIAITIPLVLSGFDWWFFEHTRIDFILFLTTVAGIVGFFVPFLVPLVLAMLAAKQSLPTLRSAAWTVLIAEGASWIITTAYKALTGRTQPEFLTHFNTIDISRDFHFGFLQHGIFWGWPSSHAATACAMAAALYLLFPLSRAVRYSAMLYAIYMTLGAAIGFHWLSDALAGALVGTAIGIASAKMKRS